MKLGGLEKYSLIDYPGMVSAVLFTQGCNFRCPYCHNPELVLPKRYGPEVKLQTVMDFLHLRRKILDGVVITGGEPTIHEDLPHLLNTIKKMGLAVKLDTNGSNPWMLELLIHDKLVDYISMDIKAAPDRYYQVAGPGVDIGAVLRSIPMIAGSGIPYQFRTTVVKPLVTLNDVLEIAKLLPDRTCYRLQPFVRTKILDEAAPLEQYEDHELEYWRERLRRM